MAPRMQSYKNKAQKVKLCSQVAHNFSKPSSGLPVKLLLSHDDSLLRKFNSFCFGADLITQSDSIKYFIFNGTIAFIYKLGFVIRGGECIFRQKSLHAHSLF